MNTGVHIQFVGIDGAGKSTQAAMLHLALREHGIRSVLCEAKEDFSVSLLQSLARQRGTHGEGYAAAVSYFGLEVTMAAQLLDMVREHYKMVLPHLLAGSWVVQSRTIAAKLAFARSQGAANLEQLQAIETACKPAELVFFLDTSPRTALGRVDARGIDTEDPELLTATIANLRQVAPTFPWVRIDAEGDPAAIHREVWKVLERQCAALGVKPADP